MTTISHNQKFKKSLFLFLLFIACLSLFSSNLKASQSPRYLGNEKKFRAFIYNPNDVYRYVGHYTYQGFIEFGEGEDITTISIGDQSLWLFQQLGNRLFLKPIAKNADTNMTVMTAKRVYHFELTARAATGIDDKDLIFVVKFIYPDDKDKNILEFPKQAMGDEPDMRDLSIYNFNYEFTGEPNIAPIKVFDNGTFTYMQFSKANPEIPAIFSVDSAGFEELVNFRVAGDYIIIERVAAQFTLRNGPDIVCVYNNSRLRSNVPIAGASTAKKPLARTGISAMSSSSAPSDSSPLTNNNPVPGFGSNPFALSPSKR